MEGTRAAARGGYRASKLGEEADREQVWGGDASLVPGAHLL